MNAFVPERYGPVIGPLVDTDRRRPLGAGVAAESARKRLAGLTVEAAFTHGQLADRAMGRCCLAGLWLLYDFLVESHEISQGIETPSGSFWHAIMHRREGDFSNAKYWFRRVGDHDVFTPIGMRTAELAAIRGASRLIDELTTSGEWNPYAFVDLVEAVEHGRRADARELCLDIQQAEWELLFDCCYGRAIGR